MEVVSKYNRNAWHLNKYHNDEEYKRLIIERDRIRTKQEQYNHYKRLVEDPIYLRERQEKGLRLRNVPEEFKDILRELIKK